MKPCVFGVGVIAWMMASVALCVAQVQPTVATLRVLSGDGQSQARDSYGNASFAPITVLATDASGNPIGNAAITFTCVPTAPMACQLTADGNSTLTVNTDSSGFAILETQRQNYASVVAYGGTGQLTVSAAAGSVSTSASLTVLENQTVSLKILQGDGQQTGGWLGIFLTPLVVGAYDSNNNPIPNALISFSCTGPSGASCTLTGTGDGSTSATTTASTGALGQATVGLSICATFPNEPMFFFQSGPITRVSGSYAVVATYRNASVTFHLNYSGSRGRGKRMKHLGAGQCLGSLSELREHP